MAKEFQSTIKKLNMRISANNKARKPDGLLVAVHDEMVRYRKTLKEIKDIASVSEGGEFYVMLVRKVLGKND